MIEKHKWFVQAWAVFVNHLHFIAEAPKDKDSLYLLIKEFHAATAIEVNRLDGISDRQVWFQFWDTCLTYEKSWLARLNYVHNNAVHHGLVKLAENYPYCSAGWFQQNANPAFVKKVRSFKSNTIKIVDDF
jgi:putative transposase